MITLGRTKRANPVVLPDALRATHMHIIGSSGKGKSKFLHSLAMQDIDARQGLCFVDIHGTECDALVEACTRKNYLRNRQIILLDASIDGWAFGFNPLKGLGPISIRVDAMVKACAQVWGGEDTNQTPTLKRCLRALFYSLIANDLTLIEAIHLLSANDMTGVRRVLTENLADPIFAAEWANLNALSRREFSEQFLSTSNRLLEFLAAPGIRSIIGQREMTLDFRKCMDEGAVVLVNLARKGGLSTDNAQLLGTLIVNDLFQTALGRPPGSRPFFVYIDECYHFLNEDVEAILDQGRKFGLHLILAHQRLGQLRKAGEHIYNAVMAGAQTKVVFGVDDVLDAKLLAEQIFAGELDLSAAKAAFSRPHVIDYVPEWVLSESDSNSESASSARSHNRSRTLGRSSARGVTVGHGVSRGTSRSQGRSLSRGSARSASVGSTITEGESQTQSRSMTVGRSVTRGHSVTDGHSETDAESFTASRGTIRARTSSRFSGSGHGDSSGRSLIYDDIVGTFPDGRTVSAGSSDTTSEGVGESETEAESESISHTTSRSRTHSVAESISRGETESQAVTQGVSEGTSRSRAESRTLSESASHSEGETSSEGATEESRQTEAHNVTAGHTDTTGQTQGATHTRTNGRTHSAGRSQTLRPVLAQDRGAPKTLEELLYEAAVRLKNQRPRFAILKVPGKSSIKFKTLEVGVPVASIERTDEFKRRAVAMSLSARPIAEVEREVAARRQHLIERASATAEEPEDFREPAPSSPAKPRPRRAAR